jgi:hypothetical protein
MYFIEKIIKHLTEKKKKKQEIIEEEETCSHFYVPIDSTEKFLACKHCGSLIQNTNKKNPFMK